METMYDHHESWRSLDQLGHVGTVEELRKRLGDKLIYDGAGVGWCNYADACRLNAEVQAERTAAAAADQRRQAELTAAVAEHAVPLRRRITALQRRDAQLRANGDADLTPFQRMALGEHDSNLDRAGRRWDELVNAERNGQAGVMHRFSPNGQKG